MSKNDYIEEIKTRLEFLGSIIAKNMFGTFAFAKEGIFFGSISKGNLYFKTDEVSVKQYKKYNMKPLSSHGKSLDYYQVPPEILDNDQLFQNWAKAALNAAIKKKKK